MRVHQCLGEYSAGVRGWRIKCRKEAWRGIALHYRLSVPLLEGSMCFVGFKCTKESQREVLSVLQIYSNSAIEIVRCLASSQERYPSGT